MNFLKHIGFNVAFRVQYDILLNCNTNILLSEQRTYLFQLLCVNCYITDSFYFMLMYKKLNVN